MRGISILLHEKFGPEAGANRPFMNWARQLAGKGRDVEFVLSDCGRKMIERVEGMEGVGCRTTRDGNEARSYLESAGRVILTDDYHPHLRILSGFRKNVNAIIYAQIFFGIHSLTDIFDLSHVKVNEKFIFRAMKAVPFSLIRPAYRNMMKKGSVVCNSNVTASILQTFYGVEPMGVVYPPVDSRLFRPTGARKERKALLYLGSNAGDTDARLLMRICSALEGNGLEIHAIGNGTLGELISKEFHIRMLDGVSDEELAEAYSSSLVTICPQKWETFGYVAAESASCGTPVLGFNCMGIAEIARETGKAMLANNSDELLEMIGHLDELEGQDSGLRSFPFEAEQSASRLEALIDRL